MRHEYLIGHNVKMYDKSGKQIGTAEEITDKNGRYLKKAVWSKAIYEIVDALSRRVYGKPADGLTMEQLEYLKKGVGGGNDA